MAWDAESTDEFGEWWTGLDDGEQSSVAAYVGLLEERGPQHDYPYSSKIVQSRDDHMRELRVRHEGNPYRVLYAFESRHSRLTSCRAV